MSQEYCCECGQSYGSSEVFDIKIFNRSWTKWCFNCATKQLKWSDYKLVPRGNTKRDIHIQSVEEWGKEHEKIRDEIILCFEAQYRKLKNVDIAWHDINNITYHEYDYIDDELMTS